MEMTNKEDEIRLQNHRCPYCHAPVQSSWNLKTTGMVVCSAKCKEGKYLMKPEDCLIEDEVIMDEFLDEVEEEC